jgi:hypothetical protein
LGTVDEIVNSFASGISGACVHALSECVVGRLVTSETFAAHETVDLISNTTTDNDFLVLGGAFAQRVLLLDPRSFLVLKGCLLRQAICVLRLAGSQLGVTILFGIFRERVDDFFFWVFREGILLWLNHLHPKDVGTSLVGSVATQHTSALYRLPGASSATWLVLAELSTGLGGIDVLVCRPAIRSEPPTLVLHEVSGVDFLCLPISVGTNAAILGLNHSEEGAVVKDALKLHRGRKLEWFSGMRIGISK